VRPTFPLVPGSLHGCMKFAPAAVAPRFRQAVVGRGGNRRSLHVSVAVQTCIAE
jgi:hypothetical protein